MFFVKCGSLEGEGVHKSIFAAALLSFPLRSLQQPASDPLAPELLADKKKTDAKPVAKCFSRQSSQLSIALIFIEYPYWDIFRCFPMRQIIFF